MDKQLKDLIWDLMYRLDNHIPSEIYDNDDYMKRFYDDYINPIIKLKCKCKDK